LDKQRKSWLLCRIRGWFGGLLGCNTPFPHRFWSCLGPGTSEAENGVRDVSLWGALLGVEKTVIERIEYDEDPDLLVAHVRPRAGPAAAVGGVGVDRRGTTRARHPMGLDVKPDLRVDVYRPLDDKTRRLVLDELSGRDGQTLFEICSVLAARHGLRLTRQAISQHLGVLEAAGLVVTERSGRSKLHYFNPEPLAEITRRWPAAERT